MVDLHRRARELLASGKGILAADESTQSANKRLAAYGISETPDMRARYRELFFGAPALEQYLSGVIVYEETMVHKARDGRPLPQLLSDRGILLGIKVDEGLEPFGDGREYITKGLLGLAERLAAYQAHGYTFTKWRALIVIEGDQLPTATALVENAKRLAAYARAAQEAGLVPILEPEVAFAGTHGRARAKEVLTSTLGALIEALNAHSVDLSGSIIKSSMVLSGKESGRLDTPAEVGSDTSEALIGSVPASLAGIVFLSGGQTPDQATENLRAIARAARMQQAPWPLTFSFARALQEEALQRWAGNDASFEEAQSVFLSRLAVVARASEGS